MPRLQVRVAPPSRMNKTEREYGDYLHRRGLGGEIRWCGFETFKIQLADNTTYTPDFAVVMADGSLEFHEVKGFWRDDARVKIKVAAETVPWATFRAVTKGKGRGGGWKIETFKRRGETWESR